SAPSEAAAASMEAGASMESSMPESAGVAGASAANAALMGSSTEGGKNDVAGAQAASASAQGAAGAQSGLPMPILSLPSTGDLPGASPIGLVLAIVSVGLGVIWMRQRRSAA